MDSSLVSDFTSMSLLPVPNELDSNKQLSSLNPSDSSSSFIFTDEDFDQNPDADIDDSDPNADNSDADLDGSGTDVDNPKYHDGDSLNTLDCQINQCVSLEEKLPLLIKKIKLLFELQKYQESYSLASLILLENQSGNQLSEEIRTLLEDLRDQNIDYFKDQYLKYPFVLPTPGASNSSSLNSLGPSSSSNILPINSSGSKSPLSFLVSSNSSNSPKIMFSITTCKRFDLFEKTMNSFLNCCHFDDLQMIDHWLCVDDNSSEEDRKKMQTLYPFFTFIFKNEDRKGHWISMNLIREEARKCSATYLLHIEDDWHFLVPRRYVSDALEIIQENDKYGQVLFNRNYAEIEFFKRRMGGGLISQTKRGTRYIRHEYYDPQSREYQDYIRRHQNVGTNGYWPHYSFRPSLVRVSALEEIGPYYNTGLFERAYAYEYKDFGYSSVFFDAFTCLHIGRKTWEQDKPNSYAFNKVDQFSVGNDFLSIQVISSDSLTWKKFKESAYDKLPFFTRQSLKKVTSLNEFEVKIYEGNNFNYRRSIINRISTYLDLLRNNKSQYLMILQDQANLIQDFCPLIKYLTDSTFHYEFISLDYIDSPVMISKSRFPLYLESGKGFIISKIGISKILDYVSTHGIKNENYLSDLNGIDTYSVGMHLLDPKVEILNRSPEPECPSLPGYKFHSHMDSFGHDIQYHGNKTLQELMELCDKLGGKCFNTLGYIKKFTVPENKFIYLPGATAIGDGLYVKETIIKDLSVGCLTTTSTSPREKVFRIKLLCNWRSPKEICDEWNHMSKGNYRWNDIQITWEDTDIDFYVIINKPRANDHYIPERTIIFQMEPWCPNPDHNWGVKTWGVWAKPDESKFLEVRSHDKCYNNGFWLLKSSYSELKTRRITKTKLVSTVCTSKYFDPGHTKRINFLKYIEGQNDPIVKVDIYNTDNDHHFKNYLGAHSPGEKDNCMFPYKYYFMAENNAEHNFMTEKIWEPLLTESLCFYWGCPNLAEYVDHRAYILLDLDKPEEAFMTMKNAILNNEWEKRLEVIRREKQKFLEYYQFFPTLERLIKHDYKFNYFPTQDDILYHKYFSHLVDKEIKNLGFLHSCNLNRNLSILREMLETIESSGLLESLDYLHIINIGEKIADLEIKNKFLRERIKIINYSPDTQLFEFPTINFISLVSQYQPDINILYLHTKGVTTGNKYQNVTDWRRLMMYFNVEQSSVCRDLLQFYDTVGCNYLTSPCPHYSGNFWWAKSSYIKGSMKRLEGYHDRHRCEFWIANAPGVKSYSLHNSQINHYHSEYPRAKYEQDCARTLNYLYAFDNRTRVKCINLLRRPDRKANVIKELRGCNIEKETDFFVAIDGSQLTATNEIKKLFTGNDFGSRRSFIGCALSHYTLWKELIEDKKYDRYVIVEDDVKLDSQFIFKLNQVYLMAPDFDLIFPGYFYYRKHEEKYQQRVEKKIKVEKLDTELYIGGYFTYVISKEGAKKMIDFIAKNGIKHGIDYLPKAYHREIGLKSYEVIPQFSKSEYVSPDRLMIDSDIQHDFNALQL